VFLLRRLVERVKELVALGYGYLQTLVCLLARLAFSDEPPFAPVRHNTSILPLMNPSLESPRLKLARADEHLGVLDEELGVFFKSYTNRQLLEHTLDGPWHVVLVNPPIKELPPPQRLSLICGDAIQNTRAALDHLIWQLVLLEGNQPDRWNSFPIYTERKKFDANVIHSRRRTSPLHGIDPNGRPWAFIEEAQPYRGGEMDKNPAHHELVVLAFLSNTDKHRTLMGQVIFPGRATLQDIVSLNPDAVIVDYRVPNQPLSLVEKTEIVRVRFSESGPDPQVRVKRKLPVQPSFGDIITMQIPLHTIKHVRGYVGRLIDRFDQFF
jgi:hypothetical protein